MSIVYTHALNYSQGEAMKKTEMDSKIGHSQQHCLQNNSGLTRYQSAPSSFLTSLIDTSIGIFNEETFRNENHHHNYSSSPSSEMETMLSNSEPFYEFEEKLVKEEVKDPFSHGLQYNDYSYESSNQMIYQTQQNQGLINGSLGVASNGFDGSFSAVSSLDSESYAQSKIGYSNNCSNLIRQKSSPAEFFSNYSVDNGFAPLRDVGSVRGYDVSHGKANTSTSGLHSTLNLSSRSSFCSIKMPQIVENEHESLQANCIKSSNMGSDSISTKCYMPSFTNDYWDSSTLSAPKNATNNGEITFSTSNAMETQDVNFGYQNYGLSHHLSLPSSSTKMATMEKYFHIQGKVPCKIRAKRGFATHPRSIAERERRIRISARIKKLQDLFPNSDKQTSTADMLDIAVEYIKDLRKQLKLLSDTKAKCTCTSN